MRSTIMYILFYSSMDIRKIIGQNIRYYRLSADLSQEGLADRIGVDRAYISGLEVGARNPTILTLWSVAEALKIKTAQLLDEEQSEKKFEMQRKRSPKRIT